MATSRFPFPEEHFLCAICLDVVTLPVSTPCGHNFCKACIQHYWDIKDIYKCPLCNARFSTRPQMQVNTVLSELAKGLEKWAQVPDQSADVLCDVCSVSKDMAVVSCLVCLTSLCETHLEPHQRVAGLRGHTLTAPVSDLKDRLCKHHHQLSNFYCKTDQTCICVVCMKTHHKTHHILPLEKEYESKLAEVPEMMAKVQSVITARSQRIREIKRSTKRAQVFNAQLIRSRPPHLVEVIEARRKTAVQQAEGFIKELNLEIAELNKKHVELAHLSHSDDHHRLVLFLSSLSNLLNEDQKNTVVDFNLPDTTCVRRCAALLAKEINLQRLRDFAVDVTLDPDTAHCNLIVSPDGKAVMLGATPRSVPDTTQRFKHHAVLSKEVFTSGKFYYEVQVNGKTSWTVGVARESVNRKNPVGMSVRNGCWVMVLDAGQYRVHGPVSSALNPFVKEKPQAVGVFVDYDVGKVSFYDATANSHIYTLFGQCFNTGLRPYLCTRSDRSQSDLKPLTITSLRLPN